MSDYVKAPVVGGQPVTGTSETYQGTKSSGDQLGKDAFLQLLVAQMENQDPMNPQSNEDMVAQLAQFSSLEELQNLRSTFDNSSTFNLVGKNVIVEVGSSTNSTTTTEVGGYVQFVKMVDGKAKLSINYELYDYADLKMVIDDAFLEDQLTGGNTENNDSAQQLPSDNTSDDNVEE